MAKFFETFTVEEEDGNWTSGPYTIDTLSGGVVLRTADVCSPPAEAEVPDFPMGLSVVPFAIVADTMVPPRCAPSDVEAFIKKAIKDSAEWTVSDALWNGTAETSGDMYLKHPDVEVIARTGDPYKIVGAALQKAYEKTPWLRPVVHLGWQSAMSLQLGLNSLNIPFVIPNGYPADAIAVTGPVKIKLGSIKTESAMDTKLNRQYFESTRMAAVEFEPSVAVRVADS